MDQIKNHYHHWKNKNYKLDLSIKLKAINFLTKEQREKHKKLKVEMPSRNTLYI
jgi:hypothetical protein